MKHPDWLDRLWREMGTWRGMAFEYGVHDCCTFVARCLDAMHGSHRLDAILAEYNDEPTALALIAREGGMRGVVTHFLGESRPAHHARRGDVVLVDSPRGLIVGICLGGTVACAGDGIVEYPIYTAVCSWCVDE